MIARKVPIWTLIGVVAMSLAACGEDSSPSPNGSPTQ